jgi:hypothetical protein
VTTLTFYVYLQFFFTTNFRGLCNAVLAVLVGGNKELRGKGGALDRLGLYSLRRKGMGTRELRGLLPLCDLSSCCSEEGGDCYSCQSKEQLATFSDSYLACDGDSLKECVVDHVFVGHPSWQTEQPVYKVLQGGDWGWYSPPEPAQGADYDTCVSMDRRSKSTSQSC